LKNGEYEIAPHAQMDSDRQGNQHNITPIGITVTSAQARQIENTRPQIRFFTPHEIAILINAGLVNGHTIVLLAEHQTRTKTML
jgi:hypothetical protein